MRAHYLLLQAWVFRQKGELAKAWELIQEGMDVKGLKGSPFPEAVLCCAAAELLQQLGNHTRARYFLARVNETAIDMGSMVLHYIGSIIEAQLEFDEGRVDAGRERLRKAFAIGRQRGIFYFAWWVPDTMAQLCAKALEAEIEVETPHGSRYGNVRWHSTAGRSWARKMAQDGRNYGGSACIVGL